MSDNSKKQDEARREATPNASQSFSLPNIDIYETIQGVAIRLNCKPTISERKKT
jgi:hypothetical protein